MRKLVWFSLGFGAACCLCAYVITGSTRVILAAAVGFLTLFAAIAGRKFALFRRIAAVLLGFAMGVGWFILYDGFYLNAAGTMDGKTANAVIRVSDYSYETAYGIGVDGMVQNGELVFLAPHEKFFYHTDKTTIPAGHGFPYRGSEKVLSEIEHQMRLAVQALGLDNCSVNADVFVDGERVSIIEIGGRTGATCIPELISMYYGFDFYEKILQNALGWPVQFDAEKQGVFCMAKLLMSPVNGVITQIQEKWLKKLREKGVIVALDFPVGHAVEAMENGTTRIGHVVTEADSVEALDNIVRKVYRCIFVDGTSLEELWRK